MTRRGCLGSASAIELISQAGLVPTSGRALRGRFQARRCHRLAAPTGPFATVAADYRRPAQRSAATFCAKTGSADRTAKVEGSSAVGSTETSCSGSPRRPSVSSVQPSSSGVRLFPSESILHRAPHRCVASFQYAGRSPATLMCTTCIEDDGFEGHVAKVRSWPTSALSSSEP